MSTAESNYIPAMGPDFGLFAQHIWPSIKEQYLLTADKGKEKRRHWRQALTNDGFQRLLAHGYKAQPMICARWTAFILQSIEQDLSHESLPMTEHFWLPLAASEQEYFDALITTRTRRVRQRLAADREKGLGE